MRLTALAGRRRAATGITLVAIAAILGGGLAFGLRGLGSSVTPAEAAPAMIVGWEPGITRNVPLTAPLIVYFSRPMERPSVEGARRLSPATRGVFNWKGTAVSFRPTAPLRPGSYYHLALAKGARDAGRKPLRDRLDVAFVTGAPLAVQNESPANGVVQVPRNGLIAITFNHPMVTLAGLNAAVSDPSGWSATVSPATPGHGNWLGTSTWVFHPDRGLVPSSTYHVTIAASAQDAWGESLSRAAVWSFRTATPAVTAEAPSNGATAANPDGAVEAAFNQPMDHNSTAKAFSLTTPDGPVPGTVSWKGATLAFRPPAPLDPAQKYTATVAGTARSASGVAALGAPVSWHFRVAPPPRVVSSTPVPDASAAESYVELHFSAPMVQSSLDQRLAVSPPIQHMTTYVSSNGASDSAVYSINGDFRPSTAYTVSIGAGEIDIYGRRAIAPFSLHFTTAPLSPAAMLYGSNGAGTGVSASAGRVVNAPVQFINVPTAHYTLISISPRQANSGFFGGSQQPPGGTAIRSWTENVPHPLNQLENMNVPLANSSGAPLGPGLYWLGVTGPPAGNTPAGSSELVAITNTGVTLKATSNQQLVWVTSAQTGRPLPNAPVTLYDSNGSVLVSGRTNRHGLVRFQAGAANGVQAAVVSGGGYFGIATSYWQPAVPRSLGGSSYSYRAPFGGTYIYTDRPIYRPGQTVHFRAIVWRDRDGVYSSFGRTPVSVTAVDGSGNSLFNRSLTPDAFGTITGDIRLPARASTGYSVITVKLPGSQPGDQYSGGFVIAAYHKPEFLTTISTDRTTYVQGQTMIAVVSVRYVFGAAVAGQHVDWVLYGQNQFATPPGWDTYQFGDQDAIQEFFSGLPPFTAEGAFGAQLAQGSGTTDDSGRLTLHLPVDIAKEALDQRLTLEATATDINRQTVTGRVRVSARKAGIEIGLAPAQQIPASGSPETIAVAAAAPDGAALKGTPLTVTVYRRTYTSTLSNNSFGSLWQDVPHDTQVAQQSVTAGGDGTARFTFTPQQGGTYYVVVTAKDAAGNTARSALLIDASSTGVSDWGATTDTSLSLRADRSQYAVGQTAYILVAAPFAGATALITTERGTIRTTHVTHFASTSPVIAVPISIADIPNIFVTVTLYRGWHNGSPPEWRYGVAELGVKVDPRRLVLHLSQERAHYRPGGTATYTVTTTDPSGHGVPAQVSLSLVDTAVLALQDDFSANILDAFYGERSLLVSTGSDGVVSIDHLQQSASFAVHPTGGGGGGGGGPSVPVYHRFADTGYWNATVLTNNSGRATVRIRLPDNFTTWRLDARGVTADRRAGQAQLFTLSTRDLVLRPVTPRFFVQGDTVRIGAIVNNTLDQPVQTGVSVAAQGLSLTTAESSSVKVPPHGERLVSWTATVPESHVARLTFTANPSTAGVQAYGLQVSIPVEPPLTDETVAASGQVFGETRQAVVVPPGATLTPGALTVQISASLTAGLGRGLSSFQPTSYDSNEDVANRLLAESAIRGLSPAISGLTDAATSRLPAKITRDASLLALHQLGDGGWPWFNDALATSDPLITADVVEALVRSGRGPSQTLGRAQRYLVGALSRSPASDRAHLVSVLAESGMTRSADAGALYRDSVARSGLEPGELSDLAQALNRAGTHVEAQSLAAALDAGARVSATGAHWEGTLGSRESPVTATAQVLSALLSLQPSAPLIPAAARWLALSRSGVAWDSPRDSAEAITALAAYARAEHEGRTGYRYTVAVDGSTKLSGTFASGTSNPGQAVSVPVTRLSRDGASSLDITRSAAGGGFGSGTLYYVARLHYYLPARLIQSLDEGVRVSRRYVDLVGHSLSSASAGSVVRVELTVRTGPTLAHLEIDDPIPAGFEPIDQSLNTSRQGLFPAWQPQNGSSLSQFLTHSDLRDDRVSLFVDQLPPGTYHYSYLAQATVAGSYAIAPVRAFESFFPEVFGRGAGRQFIVR